MRFFERSARSNVPLILNAPAKIYLHLEVLGLRLDGYHELAMVMQTINLVDRLIINRNNSDLIALSSNTLALSNEDASEMIGSK